jgi:hypothetical protein
MGMYDYIAGVSAPYDDQVKLWDCELRTYGVGDRVPAVGGVKTYSVRLQGVVADPRYVVVVDGVITAVTETVPREGSPVFSKWGGPQDEENPVVGALRELRREGDL